MALRPAEWFEVVRGGADAVATAVHAGEPGRTHCITGVTISSDGPSTVDVQAQVRNSAGANVMDQIALPSGWATAEKIEYDAPLRAPRGADVDVTLPALAAAIKGTVTIRGYTEG